MMKVFTLIALVLSVFGLLSQASDGNCADNFSELKIVVPASPGGTTDRIARGMTPPMSEVLGIPVVIVNRKGGGGLVAAKTHLKQDPADGSYILYVVQPYLSGMVFKGAMTIDDFDYLGANYWSPQALWVRNDSKFKSIKELLTAIKSDPKKVRQAFIPNSWSQVGSALISERLGNEPKNIPYNGGGKQRLALISGDVDFGISEFYGTRAGAGDKLRPLCVITSSRLPNFPNVPTLNETLQKMGLEPIPDMANFRFFIVKKGFKEKYPERWNMIVKALKAACKDTKFQDMMTKQKLQVTWKGPDDCRSEVIETHEVLKQFAEFWK